jgi:ribosomal protein S20
MDENDREYFKLMLKGEELTGRNSIRDTRIKTAFKRFNTNMKAIDELNEVYEIIKNYI